MNRNAAVEMPVTWIYVIIVGGFALLFFANIAFQTGETGLLNNARAIAAYFDDAIETLSETTNRMGKTDEILIERFSIITGEDGRSRIRYNNVDSMLKSNIYSKRDLYGSISYWAYPYKTGYKSSNLVFITDQRTRYIIAYNNTDDKGMAIADELRSELPFDYPDFVPITISSDRGVSLSAYANTEIKVICLGQEEISQGDCNVEVLPDDIDTPMNGKITFIDGTDYEYHNYGTVFAAIFAHDGQSFMYGMKIAELRHEVTGKIISHKIDVLYDTYSISYCATRYTSINTTIQSLIINPVLVHYNDILQMFTYNDDLRAHGDCESVF
ncbi:MAG: hypothetical protein ACMXYL_05660 [Candidatus Woesearchaeota archaeon]